MKKQIKISKLLLLALVFAITSCKKEENNQPLIDTENRTESITDLDTEIENETIPESDTIFPETGKKAIDFLPKIGIYKIQYQASGDLNNDGLADIALLLSAKNNKIAKRPMLILLQNKDKSYRLDKISNQVMPIEYNEADYKNYDDESINISDSALYISLYSIGPNGTIESAFKYVKNDFVLDFIEAHYAGAGGRSGLFYDYKRRKITIVQTNTMDENEPTESETKPAKEKQYLFEKTALTDFF